MVARDLASGDLGRETAARMAAAIGPQRKAGVEPTGRHDWQSC
jgi:hypothetical protein